MVHLFLLCSVIFKVGLFNARITGIGLRLRIASSRRKFCVEDRTVLVQVES